MRLFYKSVNPNLDPEADTFYISATPPSFMQSYLNEYVMRLLHLLIGMHPTLLSFPAAKAMLPHFGNVRSAHFK